MWKRKQGKDMQSFLPFLFRFFKEKFGYDI